MPVLALSRRQICSAVMATLKRRSGYFRTTCQLVLPNMPEYIAAVNGVWMVGRLAVALSPFRGMRPPGGTTGAPKAVTLSHRKLLESGQISPRTRTAKKRQHPAGRFVLPFFHSYGVTGNRLPGWRIMGLKLVITHAVSQTDIFNKIGLESYSFNYKKHTITSTTDIGSVGMCENSRTRVASTS